MCSRLLSLTLTVYTSVLAAAPSETVADVFGRLLKTGMLSFSSPIETITEHSPILKHLIKTDMTETASGYPSLLLTEIKSYRPCPVIGWSVTLTDKVYVPSSSRSNVVIVLMVPLTGSMVKSLSCLLEPGTRLNLTSAFGPKSESVTSIYND